TGCETQVSRAAIFPWSGCRFSVNPASWPIFSTSFVGQTRHRGLSREISVITLESGCRRGLLLGMRGYPGSRPGMGGSIGRGIEGAVPPPLDARGEAEPAVAHLGDHLAGPVRRVNPGVDEDDPAFEALALDGQVDALDLGPDLDRLAHLDPPEVAQVDVS